MKVFLAGTNCCKLVRQNSIYCLDSFVEINPKNPSDHRLFEDYLLDSGAFTFMFSKKDHKVDWNEYIDRYAAYVKQNGIKNYFELDIDSIVGYDNVLKLRSKLEQKVGWQCIPVWHYSRGKEEFSKMCESHKYVAIGGIAGDRKLRNKLTPYMRHFIDEAHNKGARIHGLGFTSTNLLQTLPFDSVDSTSWLSFTKYGQYVKFNGSGVVGVQKPKDTKVKDFKKEAEAMGISSAQYKGFICGIEWIKFQKYAKEWL